MASSSFHGYRLFSLLALLAFFGVVGLAEQSFAQSVVSDDETPDETPGDDDDDETPDETPGDDDDDETPDETPGDDDDDDDDDHGTQRASSAFSLGMDFGVGIPQTSKLLGPGAGAAYSISYRVRNWGIELRLSESYDLSTTSDLGARLDGQLRSNSMNVFREFDSALHPRIGVGVSQLSTSVIIVDDENNVVAEDLAGIGVVVSGEITHAIRPGIHFVLNARAHFARWENVPALAIDNVVDGAIEEKSDPSLGNPISISLGFRLVLR